MLTVYHIIRRKEKKNRVIKAVTMTINIIKDNIL